MDVSGTFCGDFVANHVVLRASYYNARAFSGCSWYVAAQHMSVGVS